MYSLHSLQYVGNHLDSVQQRQNLVDRILDKCYLESLHYSLSFEIKCIRLSKITDGFLLVQNNDIYNSTLNSTKQSNRTNRINTYCCLSFLF